MVDSVLLAKDIFDGVKHPHEFLEIYPFIRESSKVLDDYMTYLIPFQSLDATLNIFINGLNGRKDKRLESILKDEDWDEIKQKNQDFLVHAKAPMFSMLDLCDALYNFINVMNPCND